MQTNADITIFNTRIGKDRREVFFATHICGVFWRGIKGQSEGVGSGQGKSRDPKEQCVIRIPIGAETEDGKAYIEEERYKLLTDEEAAKHWTIQKGSVVMRGIYADSQDIQEDGTHVVSQESVRKLISGGTECTTVMEYADNTDRGTDRVKHWRIGGA